MQAPNTDSVSEGGSRTDEVLRARTSLLDNARNMTLASQQIRTQNFNFFVVSTAALVTGYAKLNQHWQVVFGMAGITMSAMFFLLDVRGHGLHKRSVDQMALIEEIIWESAQLARRYVPPPRANKGRQRFISHRFIYRAFFVMVGVAWLGSLIFKPTG
jgi:hypothetical protein